MSYRNGVANTANDFFQVIQAFFNEQQPVDWELLYGSASTPDRISVKHKTKDVVLAFLWYDSGVDCWYGMEAKTDGTWPGIQHTAPIHGRWYGFGMTYPCKYHIACNKGGFIVALERLSDGYCLICGGGTWQKHDISEDAGVWGANNTTVPINGWSHTESRFLKIDNGSPSGSHNGYCAEFAPSLQWLEISNRGSILPIYDSLYLSESINKTPFKLSATTVFMPVLFTRAQPQGWYVMGEVDWLRVCSTKYLSTGDVVNYNGKRWVILPHPTPSGVGIAVEI
ncbi:TPA: hypothetical protein ACGF2T_000570 [Vibrio cholerae]